MAAEDETIRRLDDLGITVVYTLDKIDGSDVATIDMDQAAKLLDSFGSKVTGPGFGDRERLARSAWGLYSRRDDAEMTHDFRGGYHLGCSDASAWVRADDMRIRPLGSVSGSSIEFRGTWEM